MRIVLVMLARNEADIIGPTLRWHLATGVDHAIVIDHDSTDATPDILSDLARDGRVTHLRRQGLYNQAEMTTELVRLAADEHAADWVVPCDADELWTCPGMNLREIVAASPNNVIKVPTVNFVPTANDPAHEADPVLRMQYKAANPPKIPKLPYVLKPIQSKVMFKVDGFRKILMGNHVVDVEAPQIGRHEGFVIHHYPLRSRDHFFLKVIQGGAALEANKSLTKLQGYHWRRWYDLYKRGKLDSEWRRMRLGELRLAAWQLAGVVKRDVSFGRRYLEAVTPA